MNVLLKRTDSNGSGTFGELWLGADRLCFTCELPWKDNQTGISCIPVGVYKVIPHNSIAHPDTWEITGVPHRTAILIHVGNTVDDLRGCLAPGTSFGVIDGKKAVIGSRAAMAKLREILPKEFTLTIK